MSTIIDWSSRRPRERWLTAMWVCVCVCVFVCVCVCVCLCVTTSHVSIRAWCPVALRLIKVSMERSLSISTNNKHYGSQHKGFTNSAKYKQEGINTAKPYPTQHNLHYRCHCCTDKYKTTWKHLKTKSFCEYYKTSKNITECESWSFCVKLSI